MALRSKVIDFSRTHLVQYLDDAHRVAQISIVQVEIRRTFEVSDTFAEVYG